MDIYIQNHKVHDLLNVMENIIGADGNPVQVTCTPAQLDILKTLRDTLNRQEDFNIISVSRTDVSDVCPNAGTLTDDQMEKIAYRMSNAYQANGFWEDLREAAEYVLKPNQ